MDDVFGVGAGGRAVLMLSVASLWQSFMACCGNFSFMSMYAVQKVPIGSQGISGFVFPTTTSPGLSPGAPCCNVVVIVRSSADLCFLFWKVVRSVRGAGRIPRRLQWLPCCGSCLTCQSSRAIRVCDSSQQKLPQALGLFK